METNLFSDDVVIIIGAGASVPFGLPTGLDLIDLVASGLRKELVSLERLEGELGREPFPNYLDVRRRIVKCVPTYCAVNEIFEDEDWDRKKFNFNSAKIYLKETAEWIESQVSDSIDDLIRYNRNNARILKIGIVLEILKRTHNETSTGFQSKNFQLRKIHQINSNGLLKLDANGQDVLLRNWIHNLINVVRNNFLRNWDKISSWKNAIINNKIKIITFNYDGILEEVLSKNWASVESKLPNWRDIFEIVHPHGNITFSNLVEYSNLPKYLFNNEKKIVVIHDKKVNKEVTYARNRAREMVDISRHIFSLGFAFANLNCILLNLQNHKSLGKPTIIEFINFDNSNALDKRVTSYCRGFIPIGDGQGIDHEVRSVSHIGKNGSNYQITDALMGGFLGEMPS